jgi:hypothetical protein
LRGPLFAFGNDRPPIHDGAEGVEHESLTDAAGPDWRPHEWWTPWPPAEASRRSPARQPERTPIDTLNGPITTFAGLRLMSPLVAPVGRPKPSTAEYRPIPGFCHLQGMNRPRGPTGLFAGTSLQWIE